MQSIYAAALKYPRMWFGGGLLIATVITVLSLIPPGDLPPMGVSDKLEHTVAYVVLAFWFASVIARYDYFWLFWCLVAFGGAIELAQGAMQLGRQAEWRDLVADGVGSLIGILLAMTPLGGWTKLIERRLPRGHRD